MIDLLTEEDFNELPEEAAHKWLHLEKVIRARLNKSLIGADATQKALLQMHFMRTVSTLAESYEVPDLTVPTGLPAQQAFDNYLLQITESKTRILSSAKPTYPFGRVAIQVVSKKSILDLVVILEQHVQAAEIPHQQKINLQGYIEDFKWEINQPKTRAGVALSKLTTVIAFIGGAVANEIISDIYSQITTEIGNALVADANPETQQLSTEKKLQLPAPQKQLEDKSSEPNTP